METEKTPGTWTQISTSVDITNPDNIPSIPLPQFANGLDCKGLVVHAIRMSLNGENRMLAMKEFSVLGFTMPPPPPPTHLALLE